LIFDAKLKRSLGHTRYCQQTLHCKQTAQAISKSPILSKNWNWQHFFHTVYIFNKRNAMCSSHTKALITLDLLIHNIKIKRYLKNLRILSHVFQWPINVRAKLFQYLTSLELRFVKNLPSLVNRNFVLKIVKTSTLNNICHKNLRLISSF